MRSYSMRGPGKISKFVNPVKVPARNTRVFLNPGKVPKGEQRVPSHILWMNKFTVLAYRPFIPGPPGDMTVLQFCRPRCVPSPDPRRVLFHVPHLPSVFCWRVFFAAGYGTATSPQAWSMANPPFQLLVSCRNIPGKVADKLHGYLPPSGA